MRYAILRHGSNEPITYSEITTLAELADALDKPWPGKPATTIGGGA